MGYEPHCVILDLDGEEYPVVFRTLGKREYSELVESPLHDSEEATYYLGSLYTEQYKEIVELAVLWPVPLSGKLFAGADRQIADAKEDGEYFASSIENKKKTLNELIEGVDKSLERFGKIVRDTKK